jgi:hypothetical protein
MWPEINYKTMTMMDLAVSGFITNKTDLISMLLAEKKMLFYLQTTNHKAWVDILYTKNGFGCEGISIKYSDIYTRKDGWKNLIGITQDEIDSLKLSVEDVCYISVRLQMISNTIDDSLSNIRIRVSDAIRCSKKNVVPLKNINTDKLLAKPLYVSKSSLWLCQDSCVAWRRGC